MEQPRQTTFDLPHRPAYGREDFFVSCSNAEAVAWIDKGTDWPKTHSLLLYGPKSSGKTHLVSVWRERTNAKAFSLDEDVGDVVFVDDVEQYFGCDHAERALFHLYNMVYEHKGALLLASCQTPADWSIGLKDLSSRLLSVPAVALAEPDDALLSAVLLKLFSDRQLRINPDVVAYLLPRIERSFAVVDRIVRIIDQHSLEQKRNITIPLIKNILEQKI